MKILHLYKKHVKIGDGITTVVNNISFYQNRLTEVNSQELPFSSDDQPNLSTLQKVKNFHRLIKKIREINPDVIFIHGIFIINIIPLIFIIKHLFRKKMILVPHCSLLYNSLKHKKIKKMVYLKLFNPLFFSKVDGIQFLNKYEEKNSISLNKKIKSYVCPNGVNQIHNYAKDFSHIKPFYLGRCDIHHKGIDILIKGISNYLHNSSDSSLIFNLYGALPTEMKGVKSIIETNRISKRIEVHPPVFSENKYKVFMENNIYIMMSRYEGMPMSVLEALSFGCICILSDGTNMADLVEEYGCGFKASNEYELQAVLNKLKSLTTDELKIMSIRSQKLINDNFLWENIASKSLNEIEYII
ncbi:glycosyltransferase [Xenorhabdus stockiae]|uniref:glycosyltransferase n=1 Tax=Xenorhabdus stockiae TaxID=351614 RepID=UPI003CF82E6C